MTALDINRIFVDGWKERLTIIQQNVSGNEAQRDWACRGLTDIITEMEQALQLTAGTESA